MLEHLFAQPKGDRMEGLLLTGGSGMGKTMVLKRFARAHPPERCADGTTRHPVVVALMPEIPTEEAILLQLLKAVGAPFSFSRRLSLIALRETVFRLFRETETRILAIDEINSLLVGTARQQRLILQLLRFLSNELQVAIVCAGMPEARNALFSDPQLTARMGHLELLPWSQGVELQAFIRMLVQSVPLRNPSPVVSSRVQRLLVARSGGMTLAICRGLERAAIAAIHSREERISFELLERPEVWGQVASLTAVPRRTRMASSWSRPSFG